MLVLTRHSGETIHIGENVEVKVLSVKGDTVQLGVVAPREIAVHRGEVFRAIQAELDAAQKSAVDPAALAKLVAARQKPSAAEKSSPDA